MKRFMDLVSSPHSHVQFNKYMLIVWTILLIPSLLWWQTSIVWLVFMSWYANTVGHWSAYTASKAEEKMDEHG